MPMNPRLLRPRLSGDPDALRYIAAVQQADGNTLEPAIRKAITDFVIGCKQDGIWSAIKASCILMGARTLSGALTPLVGTAPTNNGPFVSGDYDRETGLIGNGSTKLIDTNYSHTSDGQNDLHGYVYVTAAQTSGTAGTYFGSGAFSGDRRLIQRTNATTETAIANGLASSAIAASTGGRGVARNTSTAFTEMVWGTTVSRSVNSNSPAAGDIAIFARSASGLIYSDSRICFYSFGPFLSLSALDSRVSTLYTAIGAAI